MIFNYDLIFIGFFFSCILSLVLVSLSYLIIFQKPDLEKISSYECDFNLLMMRGINLILSFIWWPFYLLFLI